MTTSASELSVREVFRSPVLLLAFGLGSGLSPKAPGTTGTALGLILVPLLATIFTDVAYLVFVLAFAVFGGWICHRAAAKLGVHDHSGIVIDEIAGIWLALSFMPISWPWLLAAFLVFRLFDIVKPWPIGVLDRRVGGGLGIMLDDLAAGVFTWFVLAGAKLLVG